MLPAVKAHPWLRPLWRRAALLAFCIGWLVFEVVNEPGGMWLWMALGVTGWGAWELFLSGAYGDEPPTA